MAKWVFEPGHTAAEFCARHMMVSCVRGHFKNLHGTIDLDLENPARASVELEINAAELWTGETQRDDHLRSSDFLAVNNHPKINFKSTGVQLITGNDFKVTGDLTIRGVTRPVTLAVKYLGQWETPYWEDGVDKGPKTRIGFLAETKINRQDFGVSWNSVMDKGGVVVSNEVDITIDVEALRAG